jgi:hypothetical protein
MEWADPPRIEQHDGRRGAKVMEEEARELRAHPGKWAIVRSWPAGSNSAGSAGGTVNSIRKGRFAAFRPEGSFDAVSRHDPEGVLHVYARYTGEEEPTPVKRRGPKDGPGTGHP